MREMVKAVPKIKVLDILEIRVKALVRKRWKETVSRGKFLTNEFNIKDTARSQGSVALPVSFYHAHCRRLTQ